MKYQTPVWFSEFSCLGQDCPDTCCRDWEIKVDARHYVKLKELISVTPELQTGMDSLVKNDHAVTGDHDYARIKMRYDGYCAFLDEMKLCRIHAAHGIDCLGNVCAMFPRILNRHDDVIEMSGALSCPEVVRLCITSTDVVSNKSFRVASLPRGSDYPIQRQVMSVDDDYSRYFVKVRQAMITVMADERQGLELRLFMLASMANRLSTLHHKDCQIDNTELVDEQLRIFQNKKSRQDIAAFLHACAAEEPVAMVVSYSILKIRQDQAQGDATSKLFAGITDMLEEKANEVEQLDRMLACRRNKVSELVSMQIDKALTRYLVNCLYREWFISMPDSFTCVQMLLVRTGLLYVLIWLHPDFEQHAESTSDMQSLLVDVIYRFARDIDQNHAFLRVIYNALSEQQMMNFDYSAALIHRQHQSSIYTLPASSLTG